MAQNDWEMRSSYLTTPAEGLARFHSDFSDPLTGSEFGDYVRYFQTNRGGAGSGFMMRSLNPNVENIPDTKAISVRSWVRHTNHGSAGGYAFVFAKNYTTAWNNTDASSGYHFGIRYNNKFVLSGRGHGFFDEVTADTILGKNPYNTWVHIRLDVIPIKHNNSVIMDHVKGYVEVDGVWQLVKEKFVEVTDTSHFVPWVNSTSTPSRVGFGQYTWNYNHETYWDKFEVYTETVEQPGSLTLALTNDTGASNQDRITSDASITVSAPEVGAEREYSLDLTNWSNTIPTFTSGSNVLYARQVSAEGRTSPISTLEFTYIPDDSHLTITSATTASVVENSGESQVVYAAAAENPFSTVKYILKEVDDYQKFSMSTTNGQVTLADNPDYETSSSYDFTFKVQDLAGFEKEQSVVLSVVNTNDNVPTLSTSFLIGTVGNKLAENTALDTVVATLSGTDIDGDPVQFQLLSQTVDGTFALSGSSLVLTGTLNYTAVQEHTVELRATDGELNTDQEYTIYISNINDAPVLSVSFAVGTQDNALTENATVGTVVATLSATDADNDTVTFSIVSQTVDGMFELDGNSLKLAATLDYETNTTHTVVLRASDGITTVDQSHTIYVSDVNETPSFTLSLVTGTQSQPLSEGAAIDTVLGSLSATDPEGDTVSFSIVSQTVAGTFALSSSSLVLTGALDYETNTSHTVLLRASDGTNNADQSHTIYIQNINDNAPTLTLSLSTGTSQNPIPENSSIGTVLGTLSGADADGDAVTISILSQSPAGVFEISGSDFKLASALDYETNNSHTVTLRASDGENNTDQNYTIHIQDITE